MGFKFTHLCDLLSTLESNRIVKAPHEAKATDPDVQAVTRWFAQHDKQIRDKNTDQLALLSCMFPEKRMDRVYWLQAASLEKVIARCLLLGNSRRQELERCCVSGGIDLGQSVEKVMRQAENHVISGQEVTVEEIDYALAKIASRCKFSGPQDSFETALSTLTSGPISHFPPHPEPDLAKDLGLIALQYISPDVGVKIGRPDYYKARSIKHCCRMIGSRRMSIERKYDGEYCQIHIDLSRRLNPIQIFSKSGKDSTKDRAGIHQVVSDCLKLGMPGCKISRRCILEGELLVWSDKHARIEDFHKLRKFIARSGTFIGIGNDSPPQPYDHLMIVFFDILLIDDNVCLKLPHRERRLLLKDTIQPIPGRADISEQWVLDFSHYDGQSRLESIFQKGIHERWEGFVLKGCEDPYFTIFPREVNGSSGHWIKLKKDYIPGLGDTVDLAIVGARFNSRDAMALHQIKKLLWTEFFIGCLVNKAAVVQFGVTPKFRVVDSINYNCMNTKHMQILNRFGEFSACNTDSGHGFLLEYGESISASLDVVFKTPFVVEMLGSGFEKPSGARYYVLRFPRITKIHSDRSFEDAASFSELQVLAENARSVSNDELDGLEHDSAKRLKLGDPALDYGADQSQSLKNTESSLVDSRSIGASESLGREGSAPPSNSVSASQDTPRDSMRLTKRRHETSAMQRTIPIHEDKDKDSSPPLKHNVHGHYLTDNENLSSHTAGQRKDSAPTDESSHKEKSSRRSGESKVINDPDDLDKGSISLPHPSQTDASQPDFNHGPPENEVVTAKRSQKPKPRIQSPLKHIPIYLHHSPPEEGPTTFPIPDTWQTSSTLDTFLQTLLSPASSSLLKKSNPHASSQNTVYGLIILPGKQNALGTILPNLRRTLSKTLQPYKPGHPQTGKIFILDSNFLNLTTTTHDTRVCLRQTWENISRESFYACVKWSFRESSRRAGEAPDVSKEAQLRRLRMKVSFDRRELGSLGEFSSLEPLVHIEMGLSIS
ncbi:ATP dependent DNA ligase domain protein [Aspergillus ibericus CBS 121593]|uniref:ATP-dependent DNA ligase n=1 Tax=Aspergillus ibericus CBS 121593 TaxID=1448316 RepID=A0A395H5B1_9EURO|nr:ATP-dependent DNA ligase [Aspergillus ibericus CBS 121593]RAL03067.1 ATP-dependent DNA ligase [Aspergillus ibericus CBS 121593]